MLRPHLTVWEDQMHECDGCGYEYYSAEAARYCEEQNCGQGDP